MKNKDYYKQQLIQMINNIDSESILEFLYFFVIDGLQHWR